MRHAKIVYVHGHGIHPNRLKLFPSIGSEFIRADHKIPWLHLTNPPMTRKILSLFMSSVFFPERDSWDLIVGDGPQHLPVVMKKLKLLRPDQKIVPYLAGEFPYFLATGYYGERKTRVLLNWFSNWDAYLCSGEMIGELVSSLLPKTRQNEIFVVDNFVRHERIVELSNLEPKLDNFVMVFVGHGPSGHRVYYKGLDLMFEAFKIAKKQLPQLSWIIVGDWDEEIKRVYSKDLEGVEWIGPTSSLKDVLEKATLYIHCSRGDASPNTVVEAMIASVPPLISQWTGNRKSVREVDERLIVPLDANVIAERILWYFSLKSSERKYLSQKSREVAIRNHEESKIIEHFKATATEMIDYLFEGRLKVRC